MKLFWPVRLEDGAIMGQKFGDHQLDYSQFGLIGHNGIDFACPKGKPVYAVHDGWISEVTAKETGYGLRITQWWEEDGFEWDFTYGHFLSVKFPDYSWNQWSKPWFVRAGEVIGYVDSSGFSTGNHVHGTLRKYKGRQLLNYNNGYFGAIDWLPYLAPAEEKPTMIEFVNKEGTNEFGFLETTTYTVIYHRSINEDDLKLQAQKFTVNIYTNNVIDFSLAKKIKL